MPRNPAISSYNHEQTAASTEWTINHQLGFQPSVSAQIDYEGVRQACLPLDIVHVDNNTVKILFSQARTGSARLV